MKTCKTEIFESDYPHIAMAMAAEWMRQRKVSINILDVTFRLERRDDWTGYRVTVYYVG